MYVRVLKLYNPGGQLHGGLTYMGAVPPEEFQGESDYIHSLGLSEADKIGAQFYGWERMQKFTDRDTMNAYLKSQEMAEIGG